MADQTIPKNYVIDFKEGYTQAFQQMTTKFRSIMEEDTFKGEYVTFDRIGLADDMNEVTTRLGDTPNNDVAHERRRIFAKDYDWGKGIDKNDLRRVSSDPTNEYTTAALASAKRQIDKIAVAAFDADVQTDKNGQTTVSFVGTNSNRITVGAVSNENGYVSTAGDFQVQAGNNEGIDVAVDFQRGGGGANSNITKDKLIAVREAMQTLEGLEDEDDGMINFVLAPSQQAALLNISEVVDADFNSVRTLVNGRVDTWLGFKFIYSNLLKKTGSERECYAIGPRGMKLGISEDINVDMFRHTGKKNRPWIQIEMSMNALRMYGEHVAKVRCDESVA